MEPTALIDNSNSDSGPKHENLARRQATSKGLNDDAGDRDWDSEEEESDSDDVYDSDLDEDPNPASASHQRKMRKSKSKAKGSFERMLLNCIVNTDCIAPHYQDIFISKSIIDSLEQVTTLALLRKNAFDHGVLKDNKVTGAVLYGPPGTGKSLLAKGMAKQSGFAMISVSTAELWQKRHGDDEKMIKALFSLARKLHPSIVFIDEADAMLGTRNAGEKRHIRAMLNQFLMEWDGLMTGPNSPFILLATNRPFDLDPAVLRRAPVQIHLDVPTTHERHGILNLLLEHETLVGIDTKQLASLTPGYTGSDLKNLCVTAATQCVSEQLRAGHEDSPVRALTLQHFRAALEKVKATNLPKTMTNQMKTFGQSATHEEATAHGGSV
ncbi:P-loop containing nucleoside triphosphate hydrolase protein [Massariosphaeria phaeospora]|uniref:P-loop containing nucleoside triphosphate hydrolase protein n=1 Tax=Massariosphaeria phaeospora TaxID=100035 RepID=A0A7C8ML27_9PLEO|nr:P-loop containing nucleoside triphosphate hydrolase protein [Massariosphaeria phaeospora]